MASFHYRVFIMKISVVVPTINRANLLVDTIKSLIAQEYDRDDYEIIVVDNGSTDDTASVVAAICEANRDVSIKYIYEPCSGSVWARHAGAKAAAYNILSFTDDDGLLSPFWLREIARVFALDKRIVAVAGRISILWDAPPPAWVVPYEGLLGKLDYGEEILVREGLFINSGNLSIRKEVLSAVKGFNPDLIGVWLVGDGETGLCHKLHARRYLIGWSPLAVMAHRQFVSKHATIADIMRRFINNGIGIPYRIYTVSGMGIPGLLTNLIHSGASMCLRSVQAFAATARGDDAARRRALFEMVFFAAQFPYTLRIIFSPAFRRELRRDYWNESVGVQ